MPSFLRKWDRHAVAYAERVLGRKIERSEAAVLRTGEYVFIDSNALDPVTGRYMLFSENGSY